MSPESPSDLTHVRAVLFDLFHTLVSLEVSQPPGPSVSAILDVDRDTWWRAWTDNSEDYLLGRTVLERTLPARARVANPAVIPVITEQNGFAAGLEPALTLV